MIIGVIVVIAAGIVFYATVRREQKRLPPEPERPPEHWLDRWKAAQRRHD